MGFIVFLIVVGLVYTAVGFVVDYADFKASDDEKFKPAWKRIFTWPKHIFK